MDIVARQDTPVGTPLPDPVAEDEEFYSSWSLFLVCLLLILSLWTSYYLQIKRIKLIHETLVAIIAGMFVGLVVRLAPGTMIRDMLVSGPCPRCVVVYPRAARECPCLVMKTSRDAAFVQWSGTEHRRVSNAAYTIRSTRSPSD